MFADRIDAGRRLGRALSGWRGDRPIIYGLPRGGVPVAAEVAKALGAPLDVVLARKVGVPGQPELALGAVADGPNPIVFWNQNLVRACGLLPHELDELAMPQRKTIEERSALRALRAQHARRLILAVPVAPAEMIEPMRAEADDVVVLDTPPNFAGVGGAYLSFEQTPDSEVICCLDRIAAGHRPRASDDAVT